MNMDKFLKANLSLRPGTGPKGPTHFRFHFKPRPTMQVKVTLLKPRTDCALFEDHARVWVTLTFLGMEYLNADSFHFSHISKGITAVCFTAAFWKELQKRQHRKLFCNDRGWSSPQATCSNFLSPTPDCRISADLGSSPFSGCWLSRETFY